MSCCCFIPVTIRSGCTALLLLLDRDPTGTNGTPSSLLKKPPPYKRVKCVGPVRSYKDKLGRNQSPGRHHTCIPTPMMVQFFL